MHCRFYGKGATTVVYLHGWGASGDCFLPVAKQLPNYCNVMPDLNGFGYSPMPPERGWEVEDYAESVHMLFLQYNIQHATIVAHSFGCRVATVFAATYPQFCQKMLFVAPAGLKMPSLRVSLRVARYKTAKFFRRLVGLPPPTGYGSRDYADCPEGLRKTFVKVVNKDLSVYAKRVPCGVLVVNGLQDVETTPKHAKNLCKLLPKGQLQLVEGDHFVLFRSPSAFAKLVKTFVEEV